MKILRQPRESRSVRPIFCSMSWTERGPNRPQFAPVIAQNTPAHSAAVRLVDRVSSSKREVRERNADTRPPTDTPHALLRTPTYWTMDRWPGSRKDTPVSGRIAPAGPQVGITWLMVFAAGENPSLPLHEAAVFSLRPIPLHLVGSPCLEIFKLAHFPPAPLNASLRPPRSQFYHPITIPQ